MMTPSPYSQYVWLWIIFRSLLSWSFWEWMKRLDSLLSSSSFAHKFNLNAKGVYYVCMCLLKYVREYENEKKNGKKVSRRKSGCECFQIYGEKKKNCERNCTIKVEEPQKMRTHLLRIVVNHFITRKSRHPL